MSDAKLDPRNIRRQRLALKLHACGPRPVLEALIAVEKGQSVDTVLADLARLPPEIYRAVGADRLPVGCLVALDGSQR